MLLEAKDFTKEIQLEKREEIMSFLENSREKAKWIGIECKSTIDDLIYSITNLRDITALIGEADVDYGVKTALVIENNELEPNGFIIVLKLYDEEPKFNPKLIQP